MPPYTIHDAPTSLHRENHNGLSLFGASLSKHPNDTEDISLDSTTKTLITADDGFDHRGNAPLEKAEEPKHSNEQDDPNPSWFDRILDCVPCGTTKVSIPAVSPLVKERRCHECGSPVQNLPGGGCHREIHVRTVIDEKTGQESIVEETLFFAPSCFEARNLRLGHYKNGYGLVLTELHAFFAAMRKREREARRQARAEEKGKAKARAQAAAKAVRATRVEDQANATFTRKRKEAERSSALLKLASLAQESAKVARERQEAEAKRKQAERSAAAMEYEADLAKALARARAEAWARDAEFAIWDKEVEADRNRVAEKSRGVSSAISTEASSDTFLHFGPFGKRVKKGLKKVFSCHSHSSNKVDYSVGNSDEGTWKEWTDSTSGATYYYHTTTRETTWSKPKRFVEQQQQK